MAFWGKKNEDGSESSAPESSVQAAGDKSKSSDMAAASEQRAERSDKPQPQSNPTNVSAPREEAIADRYGKVRSALGPGTVIQGKLSFDTAVSIDGKLTGEVFSTKALLVGKAGVVDAQIEVAALIVRGVVKGTIKATERVEILAGGQLLGDITTPVLLMEEGCVFTGNCSMGSNQRVVQAKMPEKSDRSKPAAAAQPAPKHEPVQAESKEKEGEQKDAERPALH